MKQHNLQIRMARHPEVEVKAADFELVETPLPEPSAGQVLVRNLFLSLDPFIRPMMDPVRSYVAHLEPGDLMPGFGVGQVMQGTDPLLPEGTIVAGRFGWQTHAAANSAELRTVDPSFAPISTAVGILGMPGATAHYGLLNLGKPQPGETVVVTAASGAVGSVVGQIARIKGCRVIGIAGGAQKCAYVQQELGFDVCLDYKAPDLEKRFVAATPDYVDVLFENVGGPIADMIMRRLNSHARIALCGAISQYDSAPFGSSLSLFELVRQRVSLTGFIISEHMDHWPIAFADLARWIREGRVKYRESITEGLENAPAAFMGLLTGRNFGKQLVRIAEPLP